MALKLQKIALPIALLATAGASTANALKMNRAGALGDERFSTNTGDQRNLVRDMYLRAHAREERLLEEAQQRDEHFSTKADNIHPKQVTLTALTDKLHELGATVDSNRVVKVGESYGYDHELYRKHVVYNKGEMGQKWILLQVPRSDEVSVRFMVYSSSFSDKTTLPLSEIDVEKFSTESAVFSTETKSKSNRQVLLDWINGN